MNSRSALIAPPFAVYAVSANPLARGRGVLSVVGIALGVALAVAIHVINQSAVGEFTQAVNQVAGQADLVVSSARTGFNETLYPAIARAAGVAVASPVLELNVPLVGRDRSLKVLGLDPMPAALIHPQALASLDVAALVQSDALILSAAAARDLRVKKGEPLDLQAGVRAERFKVAGVLPESAYQQPLAIMDIATAQWRLQRLGTINRIDIRAQPGVTAAQLRARLQALLPAGARIAPPQEEAALAARLSRAYRVNLSVLALVALFTGAFLVFATQALAVVRRRTQLALVRVLGMTRAQLTFALLAEAALIGAIGAALGVALGIALAKLALVRLGGDLGAGYFPGVQPEIRLDAVALSAYFAVGVAVALGGALLPALEAARAKLAPALRAGSQEQAFAALPRASPGLILLAAGAALAFAPPLGGLPLLGYLSIACLLVGVTLLTPLMSSNLLRRIGSAKNSGLALARLRNAPGETAASIAPIIVSFSLVVAMAVMVTSFRGSVAEWVAQVTPADLYLRAAHGGDTGFFDEHAQRIIAATPGIARADFLFATQVVLDPKKPPIALLTRPVTREFLARTLPLVGQSRTPQPGEPPPIWVSEQARAAYDLTAGKRIRIPVGGRLATFTVAGIWRDYARERGSILIDRTVYAELSGDKRATDAALYLAPGADARAVERSIKTGLGADELLEVGAPQEIRALTLQIFDRSFYVTYALEAIALLIALFGVASAFAAQALARRAEFGVLRHVGATRGAVHRMVATEGAIACALGAAIGLVLGLVISLILIHVVNRQSFHWSMDISVPWAWLALTAAVLICAGSLTAAFAARQATGASALEAVRSDW